jgi:hypothetical protein
MQCMASWEDCRRPFSHTSTLPSALTGRSRCTTSPYIGYIVTDIVHGTIISSVPDPDP